MMQPEIRHILYYHSTNYYLTHTGQNETEICIMHEASERERDEINWIFCELGST